MAARFNHWYTFLSTSTWQRGILSSVAAAATAAAAAILDSISCYCCSTFTLMPNETVPHGLFWILLFLSVYLAFCTLLLFHLALSGRKFLCIFFMLWILNEVYHGINLIIDIVCVHLHFSRVLDNWKVCFSYLKLLLHVCLYILHLISYILYASGYVRMFICKMEQVLVDIWLNGNVAFCKRDIKCILWKFYPLYISTLFVCYISQRNICITFLISCLRFRK